MRLPLLLLTGPLALLAACGPGSSPATPTRAGGATAGVAPGLVFESPQRDLGALRPGRGVDVRYSWRRIGAGPVRVLALRTDCGCATLDDMPATLPAGAAGTLGLRLTPRRGPGPFRVRARLYTDAPPPSDRVLLVVRGYVGVPLAFRPRLLALGPRSPGAVLRRAVEVRWDPAAAPEGAPAVTLWGLAGTARLEPAAAGSDPSGGGRRTAGWLLRLELHAPQQPGPFEAEVALYEGRHPGGHRTGRRLGTLPISGTVRPAASARWPRPRGSPCRVPPR